MLFTVQSGFEPEMFQNFSNAHVFSNLWSSKHKYPVTIYEENSRISVLQYFMQFGIN